MTAHTRTRIVWDADERQAIIDAALDINSKVWPRDPLGQVNHLDLFRQAQDEAIRQGGVKPHRRRNIDSVPRATFGWYLDGFIEGQRQRQQLEREATKAAAQPAAQPAVEPVAEPLPVRPEPLVTQAPPEARPEPPAAPPHLQRPGLIGRPADNVPGQIPSALPVFAGLDAVPVPDLLSALFRRLLGVSGPDNPAVLQKLDAISNLLVQMDQRVASLERPKDNGEVRELRIGGMQPIQVRVAPEPPTVRQPEVVRQSDLKFAATAAPVLIPVSDEPKPKEEIEKPKIAIVVTRSGNVDNHIRRECSKLADLTFYDKEPKLDQLRSFNLIVLTKWCDKGFIQLVEGAFTVEQYVYIPGNAGNLAEQLKIGLLDMLDTVGMA